MSFMDDLRSPIVVDLETSAHPCAAEYLEPPNLDAITAAKNLKDPAKIADDLARRKADALAEYETQLSRAALDWNLSRIVAIGWYVDGDPIVVETCQNEAQEAIALIKFWQAAAHRQVLGFCARTFDVPTLIQRSRLLNLSYRSINLARFGKGNVIDLRDLLTFDDARYEALMPRSLKMFCRRFGLPVEDTINGSDIGQLVADGKWDDVAAHVRSDVDLMVRLAQRIGVLSVEEQPVLLQAERTR